MIGRSGERGSGISVLAARHHDDDDDDILYIIKTVMFVYISIQDSIKLNGGLSHISSCSHPKDNCV